MKYLITEEQASTVKKINVMEKFIDMILSEYDWYEGIDKVSVEKYRISGNHKRSIPLYVFYVTTNDYKKSYHEYKYDTSIYDEINDICLAIKV